MTGEFRGENCHGAEKVRAFRERFGSVQPEAFYSDSYSDTPMAGDFEKGVSGEGRETAAVVKNEHSNKSDKVNR